MEVFLSRAIIKGDPIFLRYEDAQRFALAIHELATNAAKHGALSVPHSKIQIAWIVTRAGKRSLLKLLWSEAEGPILALPMREGFGTILLKSTFPGIRLDYSSDGFHCELDYSLASEEFI